MPWKLAGKELLKYCRPLMYCGTIQHYIAAGTITSKCSTSASLRTHKTRPYLTLKYELWVSIVNHLENSDCKILGVHCIIPLQMLYLTKVKSSLHLKETIGQSLPSLFPLWLVNKRTTYHITVSILTHRKSMQESPAIIGLDLHKGVCRQQRFLMKTFICLIQETSDLSDSSLS